jgi:hypothetical protein
MLAGFEGTTCIFFMEGTTCNLSEVWYLVLESDFLNFLL